MLDELESYMDRFSNVRIRGNKLQACSPFRNERHPSFAVNLDNGLWVDSGADDEGMRKGNFITLLAFFRNESYNETSEHLFEKYLHILDDVEGIKLSLDLDLVTVIEQDKYRDLVNKPSEYLKGRGISEEMQRYFNTGVGTKSDCVALPWHDKNGRIINVKYRSTATKEFWYSRGGQPVKNHIYGLFVIRQYNIKTVWVVESEIDCLYLWSVGIPSIAFGGASMSDAQYNLLRSCGVEKLIIATDNDTVGDRFANVIAEEFLGIMEIYRFEFPENIKDVNELKPQDIINGTINKFKIQFLTNN